MTQVKDIMSTLVIDAKPSSTLDHVIRLLARYKIGLIPIVDQDKRLITVISERDLPKLHAAEELKLSRRMKDVHGLPKKVITVSPETSVYEAAFLMEQHDIRHLPVVNESGVLIGMISSKDVSKVLFRESVKRIQNAEEAAYWAITLIQGTDPRVAV